MWKKRNTKMSNLELLSDQGLRLDGRRPNELRHIKCKLGVFEQHDGSAYLEQGNTKVLAAVYGPHQAHSKRVDFNEVVINCQYSMATFSTAERKKRPRGDRKSQEITLYLRQSLKAAIRTELYPRSQIDVYVEVLQADGANYAVALNAATLALVDAGICLKEFVIACTASLSKNNVPLMDVSHFEEVSGGPTLTVASLPLSNKIAFMEMSQRFHLEHLPKVLEHALNGCRKIKAVMEKAVRKHLMQMGSVGDWTTPEGKWTILTAESVVFTCCPPAPLERLVSIFNSFSNKRIAISAGLGITATEAVLVCTRPYFSVVGTLCTR
uniref:RNase_PH domain-containing protein n=1 Tax=Glossina austeni TaxID=7395 RepID=A0A1A9UV02_GLOAU